MSVGVYCVAALKVLDYSCCHSHSLCLLVEMFTTCVLVCVDMSEIVVRISRYITGASYLLQLPVAEAMLTYKEKRFVRFIAPSWCLMHTQEDEIVIQLI